MKRALPGGRYSAEGREVTQKASVPAAKLRFRTARFKIEQLERDLRELIKVLPVPSREEFEAMLKRNAAVTPEAWLVGALSLARFYLAEAGEIAGQALGKTKRSLRKKSYRLDLLHSLAHVVDDRERQGK